MVGLVGRERELASLTGLLDHAVGGAGGALVVRGEAGIGKSALIEEAQRLARERGMTILAARGVATEILLPFGGLHQLVWRLLRDGTLPESPRESLRVALGQAASVAPDFYAVAMSVLELLVEAAEAAPVLVIAEDAHWFDRPSADLLGFIARRVSSAPIAVLAAVRDGPDDPFAESNLPELRPEPLPDRQARALLGRSAADLPLELRERLLDMAAGNPLALLELPNSARGADDGALASSRILPLNDRLERAFSARLPEMPPSTRTVLLAAAAEQSSTLGELLAVAASVRGQDTNFEALDPAVAAGLVHTHGPRIRFRHPLVASAIYHAASPSDRMAVHSALAEALSGEPDRAIWHRMAAAIGADPAVVAELRAFADRAARRGAAQVAVAALERAAAFCDGDDRVDLLLSAAEIACETGQARERVPHILEEVKSPLSERDTARRIQVESVLAPVQDTQDIRSLAEQAEHIWEQDRDLAYTLLHAAAIRCYWGGASEDVRALVRGVGDRLDPQLQDPRTLLVHAYSSPMERGADLVLKAEEYIHDPDLRRRRFGVGVYGLTGDFLRSTSELGPSIAMAQRQGQILLKGRFVLTLSGNAWYSGDWEGSVASAIEAERIGREVLEPSLWASGRLHRALIAVCRGDTVGAEQIVAESMADPSARGNRPTMALAQMVRGLVSLVEGRSTEAMDRLLRIFDSNDAHHHYSYEVWALPELAEAALATNRLDESRLLLQRMERRAADQAVGAHALHLAFAGALLATEGEADDRYDAVLEKDLAAWPFLRARLNLAYGRHLRRRMRITESRVPLRLAVDLFDQLGAVPWLEQTRSELRAAGEKSPSAPPGMAALTAQELQIARLAAHGLSNREIGQQLYLSPRTVGSHLYKIFPKLGITRRSQLNGVIEP